jgi:hypothetical protein
MVETVGRSLATTQEKETNPDAELLLPLFKVAHYQADAYVGHQVSVTNAEGSFVSKYVATSAQTAFVELACREANCSINKPLTRHSEIIQGDFLFGKYSHIALFAVNSCLFLAMID